MTSSDARPHYTFGDTPLAVERLLLLARAFEPSSRAFVRESVPAPPRRALDVGCGPGASTRVVAEETGAISTLGLDSSTAFLEVARRDALPGVSFTQHDATDLPLPRAPVDLVYCRLLLAHLPDVAATVGGFVDQLVPGGLLLIEEMEWIDAPLPALATYERIVVDLVGSRGAPMYAGPILAGMPDGERWTRREDRVDVLPIGCADAARLYGMNLATWRDDPHIRERYAAAEIDRLATDLAELAATSDAGELTWGVRRLVITRTAPRAG